jgi:hypothetical protein
MARSLVLFAHIVGVLTLFTGLILEWVGWSIVQGSTARAETLAFMRVTVALQRVYGVAFVTILASGFYLGGRSGVLGDGWMRATYLGLVLIALSGAVARPRVRRIREALADPSDRAFSALRSSAHDTALRVSLHARVALVLGTAIAVIGLALVSALATSLTRSRVAPAAFRSSLP